MEQPFEEQDVQDFISRCVKKLCLECGRPVIRKRFGRPQKFCSELCRRRYWKEHPEYEKWDSFEAKICPVCGCGFFARRENTRVRKYCSRACANRSRSQRWRDQAHDG